jgi:hypothetical protein
MTSDESDTAADLVRALRQTWPWAAFVGVLAIGTVLLEIGSGIFWIAGAGLLPREADPFGVGRWIGPVYIALGILYVLPTVLMLRIALATARTTADDGLVSALRAVRALRDWWIAMGVFAMLALVGTCAGVIAMVAASMFMASRM